MKYLLLFICLTINLPTLKAQTTFPDACLGVWTGTMQIYAHGSLRASIPVRLTVAKATAADTWTWKTEYQYLSSKTPIVKDYILRLKDPVKGLYSTDEGNGLELTDYLLLNKLYCVSETASIIFTSTYELRGDELVFEITSGKKLNTANQLISNYSVDSLQRVVFSKSR